MNRAAQNTHYSTSLNIGLIYDLPEKLERTNEHLFPVFAEAEWETESTIGRLCDGWKKLGHNVIEYPIDKNFLSRWQSEHAKLDLVHTVVEGWGSLSREAWIPALCELSGIPYIGSNPFAQCLAMRKSTFKIQCIHWKIPTPEFAVVQTEEDIESLPSSLLSRRHFIKPDCEGSGMGIDQQNSLSQTPEQTQRTCREMLKDFPDGLIIEEFIDGIELTSAFLGPAPIEALPIAQIEVPTGVYGLANKSKDSMEEKVTFPKLSAEVTQTIHLAMQILQSRIGFEDFTRFDWKINHLGVPLLLEANPLAGLSYYYSVLPKMAAAAGIEYETLLERLARSALTRKNDRRFWYGRSRVKTFVK